MSSEPVAGWLIAHPEVPIGIYSLVPTASDAADFLQGALKSCLQVPNWKGASLVRAESGKWVTLGAAGAQAKPSVDLLADALDQGNAVQAGSTIVSPLAPRQSSSDLLVVVIEGQGAPFREGVTAVAKLLHETLQLVQERTQSRARLQRLETILGIAADWTQTLEMPKLLERIAAASAQLLDAERATIFLWDPQTRMLIGRPALGVAGGELRISENTGVVGQVVRTREPRRVGVADEFQEIDHSVDQQLKFRTRSLLCVPLQNRRGNMLGAFELINKRHGDFTRDDEVALTELAAYAAIALENSQQHEHVIRSRNQIASQAASRVQWLGDCPASQKLRQTVERIAATDLAVLVLGENGTGKEVVAQMIHYLSPRRNEPFVAVNCAALPDTLLESELFGHERGAFTDAREMRQGKFELASGGTLLLDEIGDMSLSGQAKLLRVLEEKVVVRIGGSVPIHTDARIIAATNQNLAELVNQKKFRQDLFFRLTVVTLDLPPLRDRGEDVILLAEHFAREFAIKAHRPPPNLTAGARRRLLGHHWPGNVRELRNLMERLVYLLPNEKIEAEDLSFITSPTTDRRPLVEGDLPLNEATREFQIAYIQQHIERARGNMTDAAERLALHRSNLYRKMKQLGMDYVE
jgi:transcriptional regulator with GAF, ATPase, and Fis domain